MQTSIKFIVLIIVHLIPSNAKKKFWQPSEKYNWEYTGNNQQCSAENIVYQKNMLGAVIVPEEKINKNIKNLVLPINGALIFKSNEAISFQSKKDMDCDSSPLSEYVRRRLIPRSWFLSRNWHTDGGQNKAIPHIEQIPCECDNIIFPKNQSISVSLWPSNEISIKSIEMNGKLSNFDEFRQTELGQIMFGDNLDVNVQSSNCDPPKFCGCFSDRNFMEYESILCYAEEQYCDVPKCLEPIKPIGHCCNICGATLLVNVTQQNLCSKIDETMEKVEKILYQLDDGKYLELVDIHASIVPQNRNNKLEHVMQLIIVDKSVDYHGYSVELIDKLIADRMFKATFGYNSFSLKHQSGIPYTPSNSSPLFFLLFGTLLMVLTFFTVIHIYYNKQPKWMTISFTSGARFFSSPFMFARFDNATGYDDDAASCINVEFDKRVFEEEKEETNDIETVRPDELNDMGMLSGTTSTSVNNLVEVELDVA